MGRRRRFIALIGPDGSGKTTLAAELRSQALGEGTPFLYVHWRPPILTAPNDVIPSGAPAPKVRRPARITYVDRLASFARLLRSVVLFNAAFVVQILPRLRGGSAVVADRWVYNYVLQPMSVRYYGSARVAEVLCTRCVVRPSVVFALKADPARIVERKPELTMEEVCDELHRIDRLARRVGVRVLDATLDPAMLAAVVRQNLDESDERLRVSRRRHRPTS